MSNQIQDSSQSHSVSRRGFIELVMTAGLGLVAMNASPNIAWAAGANGAGSLSKTGVKARFIVGSDIHIQNNGGSDLTPDMVGTEGRDAVKKLQYLFEVAKQIGNIDAYAFVGDLTDYGRIDQYHRLLSIIKSSNTEKTQVIYCQGNHETYTAGSYLARSRFESQTGQQANKVVTVNGVTVITMGPIAQDATHLDGGDANYVPDSDWFVNTALPQTTDGKPFLVLSHHQIRETTYTSHEWYGTYSQATVNAMKAHPNLLHISGHSHATTEDERSIGQDFGFTAIQDGTVGAYYENERGKVDPNSGDGASVPPQTSPAYTANKNIQEASQCLVVDVNNDGTIKVYRVSLVRSKVEGNGIVYLYDPWVINVPAMVKSGNVQDATAFPYTESRVSNNKPVFDKDAKVTVSPQKNGTSVKVTFPAATPGSGSNLDMIHEYKLTAQPTGEDDAVTKRIFSDYYRPAAYIRKTWEVLFKGLRQNTEYTMSVVAQTSWNKEKDSGGIGTYPNATAAAPNSTSDAIVSAAFTTGKLEKPDVVLDIDYRYGGTTDAKGHTPNRNGGPKLVRDEQLGCYAYESDGKTGWGYLLEKDEYDFFTDVSTTECFFKLVNNQKDQCLFSNQQSAGAGFEVENGKIEFWYNSASGRVIPATGVKTGEWVHAIAVADGKNVTLYVNGKQVDQKAATTMTVPNPRRYYVGCDANDSNPGQPELVSAAGTRVAIARLYPRAFTAAEVAKAYEAAKNTPKVPEKVLDIDFRNGNAKDAAGHTLTEAGGALVVDATLGAGKKAFEADGKGGFAYQLTDADYQNFAAGHQSAEVYFKVPEGADIAASGEHAFFSNQEGAGSGIEIEKGVLKFYYRDAASDTYVQPGTDAKAYAGKWTHVVATADGVNVRLYVNGKKVAEVKGAAMKVPANGAKKYYVGCDTNGSGKPQFPIWAGTRIAVARLYTKALSDDEIAAAYKEVAGEQQPEPAVLTPLLNVDFRRRSPKDWTGSHTLDRTHYSGGSRMDKTLRQPVAMMDGKGGLRYALAEGDYDKMAADGFTTELLFRVPKIDDEEHALFSAQQSAGSGFEVTGDKLQFWYNLAEGGHVVPETAIKGGTWYHAVAVADRSNVTLYVDGEQVAVAAAGSVKPGPLFYYVGCDTTSDGQPEYPSLRNTAIAFARVYTGAASDDQVADLFKKSGLKK